jgi:allophanate hydrolase subunit 1
MIHEPLQVSPAGDRHVLATLGDDASLEANFLAPAFAAALNDIGTDAITDLVPSDNSVLIQYDFSKALPGDVLRFAEVGVHKAQKARMAIDRLCTPESISLRGHAIPWIAACFL